jgi:protein O-mannosyl-transferase
VGADIQTFPETVTERQPPFSRRATIALIALAALLPYANALWCDFALDDFGQIVNNPDVHTLSPPWHLFTVDIWGGQGDHWQMPKDVLTGAYRPVYLLTCALQWAIHGEWAMPFHLINLLLHMAICLLLWRLTVRLGASERTASLAALLFAVLPIHTEAVTGIVGRSELFGALGMMAAVFTWIGPDSHRGPPPWGRVIGASLWIAMAIFSKESAVAAPLLVILADVHRGQWHPRGRWLRWLVLFAPLALYFAARWGVYGSPLYAEPPAVLDNPLVLATFWERALAAPVLLFHGVRLMLYPIVLSSDYSLAALEINPPPWGEIAAAFASLTALVALIALARPWRRDLICGVVGMGLTTALLLNWPLLSLTIFAERLFYMPSVFFCLLLAASIAALWRHQRSAALGLMVALVALWGARTAIRNLDWRSNFHISEATLAAVPNSARAQSFFAAQMLGTAAGADERGLPDEAAEARMLAEQALHRALEIWPEHYPSVLMLARVAVARGQWDEAERLLAISRPHIAQVHVADVEAKIRAGRGE